MTDDQRDMTDDAYRNTYIYEMWSQTWKLIGVNSSPKTVEKYIVMIQEFYQSIHGLYLLNSQIILFYDYTAQISMKEASAFFYYEILDVLCPLFLCFILYQNLSFWLECNLNQLNFYTVWAILYLILYHITILFKNSCK